MKITLIDANTKQPYAGRAVLVNVKEKTGQSLETLTLRTSQTGSLIIDQKFQGKQLSISINGSETPWITAADNATIELNAKEAPEYTKTQAKEKAQYNLKDVEKQSHV